jgi:hypothetical protein
MPDYGTVILIAYSSATKRIRLLRTDVKPMNIYNPDGKFPDIYVISI